MSKRGQFALFMVAAMFLVVATAQATSHIRIVRLSYESGSVQMDRATGQGLERAMLNSPIVEGSRIVTGNDGLAEVEFENNSSVRIGEMTEVRFRELLLNDAGDKINEVELVRGTLYFDTRSSKADIYRVVAANQTFMVSRNSQVRFQTSGDQVRAAVLSGSSQMEAAAQPVLIKKSDTLTVDATNPQAFVLAKGVDKLPLDAWNNERAAYQNVYSYNNNYGYGSKSMGGFGYSDLAYYGAFQELPGWGLAWQPYGASGWSGWDPYSSGAWMLASGGQYVWASAYPWGWMPYHYGAWVYVPASGGWFWTPGNSFKGGGAITNWQGTAPVRNAPAGYAAPTPPAMPTNGHRATVLVGQVGRVPAYIPGGPVPPDFRSVIQDHTGLTGMAAPLTGTSGGGGSSSAARNVRSANSRSVNSTVRTGSSFASPRALSSGQSASASRNAPGGHVFITPQPAMSTWSSEGFGTPSAPSLGRSSGAPVSSSAGMGRVNGTSAGHASSAHTSPK